MNLKSLLLASTGLMALLMANSPAQDFEIAAFTDPSIVAEIAGQSVVMRGRSLVEGEPQMGFWRFDSFAEEGEVSLKIARDEDTKGLTFRIANLGDSPTGVLYTRAFRLEPGEYRLSFSYQTEGECWAVMDLRVDAPRESFEEIVSSRVAASKSSSAQAGTQLTLLPTRSEFQDFRLEFRILQETTASLVFSGSGSGDAEPLWIRNVQIERLAP